MRDEHILLLGASGASGLAFLDVFPSLAVKPILSLYVRPGGRSKLPGWVSNQKGIRIVEGELNDTPQLEKALGPSTSPEFPKVTTVISFLGAYLSFWAFLTRDQSHPISDSIRKSVLPSMRKMQVTRILILSTPSAFRSHVESQDMTWKWWFYTWIPILFAPQGNAEMKGIANAVADAGLNDQKLDWTIFRVPHLNDGDVNAKVIDGELGPAYAGSTELSRGSLVRWVLGEIEAKAWMRRAPMLGNS